MTYDLDIERNAIGAMMLSKSAADIVASELRESDFVSPAHATMFRVLSMMALSGEAPDVKTAVSRLEAEGVLSDVGGTTYVIQAADEVPSAANAKYYAKRVRELAHMRRLDVAADRIKEAVASNSDPVCVQEIAERAVFSAPGNGSDLDDSMRTARDLAMEVTNMLQGIEEDGPPHGTMSGFYDLDAITTGMYPHELTILAARPGIGKTALATNIAWNVACNGGHVVFFSMEMSARQLAIRMASSASGTSAINRSDCDLGAITEALSRLYELPIAINEQANLSPGAMRSILRRYHAKQGTPALVIVDYLQLMRSDLRIENRTQEVSYVSRSLKNIAKEFNCHVMALSQLNRQSESRMSRRPNLSDLRDSGEIEASADVVALMYRDSVYNRACCDSGAFTRRVAREVVELIIAKHRNGPVGTVLLAMDPRYTKFANLDVDSQEEYWNAQSR